MQEETAGSVAIVGLHSGETYDFRLQHWQVNYFASPMTAINSLLRDRPGRPPAELVNLTLAIVGGQALLRWDLPVDLDVQYGGWVMFRHSPDMDATLWPNTTSLARAVTGDQTHVFLPLKPGTYFARVYDADGRPSDNFAYVSTKQASVLAFSPVDEVMKPDVHRHQDDLSPDRRRAVAGRRGLRQHPRHRRRALLGRLGGVASSGLYRVRRRHRHGLGDDSPASPATSCSKRSTSTTSGTPRSARSTLGRTLTAPSAPRSMPPSTAS